MRLRIKRSLVDVYVLDFETHNDDESITNRTTGIWLGIITDTTNTITITKISELIPALRKLAYDGSKRRNVLLYIHNLAFEWSFILPALYDEGFTWDDRAKERLTFSCVCSPSGSSVWNAKLNLGTKYGKVELRDSSKMFNTSVAKLAKNYGLEVEKGEIDYHLNRLHNHVVTEDEWRYCYRDNEIVYKVLENFKDDKNFFRSISSASYACNELVAYGYKAGFKKTSYKQFRKEYPELSQEEAEYTRNALSGGITWVNPEYQYVELKNVYHVDIHSAHPTQAHFKALPYGRGVKKLGQPKNTAFNKMCICRVKISYDSVIVPSVIQLLQVPFCENYEITLYDFEIELMYFCYKNFKVEYLDFYEYKVKRVAWKGWYAEKYRLKNEGKQHGNKYQESFNKLMLNAGGYGKFVEKAHNTTIIPVIDDYTGYLDTIKEDNEIEKFNGKYTYIPMGACIPAYTRYQLVRQALEIMKKGGIICYFDTDSIFFIIPDETQKEAILATIPIGDGLGEWAFEPMANKAVFELPKRYVLETDKGVDRKAGGFNGFVVETNELDENGKKIKRPMTYEEVLKTDKIEVLMRVKAVGGTLLVPKEKLLEKPAEFADRVIYDIEEYDL